MKPRPRNFTSSENWINGYDLPAVYRTVSEGIKGTSMAAFDYLSKQNRMALAHHVQSLMPFPHPPGKEQAMADLANKLAAAGEKTPNKIPVSQAMARLRQEYRTPVPLVIDPADTTPGAILLRRVISDSAAAARTLSVSGHWRTGPKELAESILPGAPANGFFIQAATWSAAEWQALHEELIKRAPDREAR
jgi:hypothetical protein